MTVKHVMRTGFRLDGDEANLELTFFPETDGPNLEIIARMCIAGEYIEDCTGLEPVEMRILGKWLLEMARRGEAFKGVEPAKATDAAQEKEAEELE